MQIPQSSHFQANSIDSTHNDTGGICFGSASTKLSIVIQNPYDISNPELHNRCCVHNSNYFCQQSSREQLAIAEFAQALLVIPKTLAVNAAQDSTDLIAKLRAFHNASQTMSEREGLKW